MNSTVISIYVVFWLWLAFAMASRSYKHGDNIVGLLVHPLVFAVPPMKKFIFTPKNNKSSSSSNNNKPYMEHSEGCFCFRSFCISYVYLLVVLGKGLTN